MDAAEFRRWAAALLGPRPGAAARAFLALPRRWEEAAGPGHFFESSVSTRAPQAVKLALILEAPPDALSGPRRDAPEKAEAAAALLAAARRRGGSYDEAAAGRALGLLKSWRLRGSLMISADFDRARKELGKLSLYAYLPEAAAAAELVRALGPASAAGKAAVWTGADLEFWALDLWPDGARALKLYHRVSYAPAAVPEPWRRFAGALSGLGEIRDVTRLTRISEGGAAARDAADKVYFGLKDGVPLASLARLRLPGRDGYFRALSALAPGQLAFFVGLGGSDVEVYFDRRRPAAGAR